MFKIVSLYCAIFLIGLLMSCDDAIDEELDNAQESYDKFVVVYCDCYTESEYDGKRETCEVDKRESVQPSECEQKALDRYPEESPATIKCFTEALDGYRSCISSCPMGIGGNLTCALAYASSIKACADKAPAGLVAELDACNKEKEN